MLQTFRCPASSTKLRVLRVPQGKAACSLPNKLLAMATLGFSLANKANKWACKLHNKLHNALRWANKLRMATATWAFKLACKGSSLAC
jgi:hypothetical protein